MPSDILTIVQSYVEPWMLFVAEDPMLRLIQILMLLLGSVLIFFVFFTTRDILLRTESSIFMFFCILLVAAFPLVGFLLYLLIRPQRTLKERNLERMVQELFDARQTTTKAAPKSRAKKKDSSPQ